MATSPDTSMNTSAADSNRFRTALSHHPGGVVVVTADASGEPVGLTATSFTSISLAPPLVGFYVAESSATWAKLRRADEFGVNLLGEDQSGTAQRFAAKNADRFAPPTSWRPGPEGVPLLDGTAVHLVCRRYDTRLVGDHWLVVGEVTHCLEKSDPQPPLLYHRGAFGSFTALD